MRAGMRYRVGQAADESRRLKGGEEEPGIDGSEVEAAAVRTRIFDAVQKIFQSPHSILGFHPRLYLATEVLGEPPYTPVVMQPDRTQEIDGDDPEHRPRSQRQHCPTDEECQRDHR